MPGKQYLNSLPGEETAGSVMCPGKRRNKTPSAGAYQRSIPEERTHWNAPQEG